MTPHPSSGVCRVVYIREGPETPDPREAEMRCGNFQRAARDTEAWLAETCECPDCGSRAVVFVRQTDLFPYAKIRAHAAPPGVTPSPYGVTGRGFQAWPS